MDIHFCDVCSEQVFHDDLTQGFGRIQDGRVVCGACLDDATPTEVLTEEPAAVTPQTEPVHTTTAVAGTHTGSHDRTTVVGGEELDLPQHDIATIAIPRPDEALDTDDEADGRKAKAEGSRKKRRRGLFRRRR